MRLLLDTHVLIWAPSSPHRLAPAVRAIVSDRRNEVLSSAASIWEIAIKARLAREDFGERPDRVAAEARAVGFTELPILADTAAFVADLELHHGDRRTGVQIAFVVSTCSP